MTALSLETLQAAADLVHEVCRQTPQICWPLLSARVGTEVWVKHETTTPPARSRCGRSLLCPLVEERQPNVRA